MEDYQQNTELIGQIIGRCNRLEKELRRAGATGVGLRELSESLGEELGQEHLDLLRYIGAVRNQLAHELSPEHQTVLDPELFDQSCTKIEQALAQLHPEAFCDPLNEVQDKVEKAIRVCAFVPVLHALYPLRALYAALRPGAGLAAALIIGAMAIAMFYYATEGKFWYFVGGGLLLMSYAYSIWHAMRPTLSGAPKWLAYLPGLNFIYLVWSLTDVVKWEIFSGALVLSALNSLIYFKWNQWNEFWLVTIFLVGYLATAISTYKSKRVFDRT